MQQHRLVYRLHQALEQDLALLQLLSAQIEPREQLVHRGRGVRHARQVALDRHALVAPRILADAAQLIAQRLECAQVTTFEQDEAHRASSRPSAMVRIPRNDICGAEPFGIEVSVLTFHSCWRVGVEHSIAPWLQDS